MKQRNDVKAITAPTKRIEESGSPEKPDKNIEKVIPIKKIAKPKPKVEEVKANQDIKSVQNQEIKAEKQIAP